MERQRFTLKNEMLFFVKRNSLPTQEKKLLVLADMGQPFLNLGGVNLVGGFALKA